ncbi:hypothetical protein ACFL03_00185 [Thermodesulfobacteriota bacterium]
MKKFLIVIFGISLVASLAFGDEVDRELSTIANEQIRTHTRAMVNAGIHRDEAVKVTKMMIQNNYQNQNTIRAQQILMATVKESLPVKPVMNKAFEGLAKNAPQDLVLRAMERTRYRYSIANNHARQITQNTDRIHDITKAIAEGFTAGIHNKDAVQVMNRLQNRTQQRTKTNTEALAQESFLSLRDMARLGVSSRIAKDVVCHAHNQQYSTQEMKQLRHSFMSHSRSTDPVKLANQYSHAISHGVRAENLSSDIHTQPWKTDDQRGAGDFDASPIDSLGGGPGGGFGGGPGGGSGGRQYKK